MSVIRYWYRLKAAWHRWRHPPFRAEPGLRVTYSGTASVRCKLERLVVSDAQDATSAPNGWRLESILLPWSASFSSELKPGEQARIVLKNISDAPRLAPSVVLFVSVGGRSHPFLLLRETTTSTL